MSVTAGETITVEIPITAQDLARFWTRVDASGGEDACWPWLGKRGSRSGRGKFTIGSRVDGSRRELFAYRVAYYAHHGTWPIPVAMHTCDNPICCNPAHIRAGTQADNLRDMYAKGRNRDDRGERHPRAIMTERDVCECRRSYQCGITIAELARKHGVVWQTMRAAVRGRSWAHLECAA
jgi:hypothetical protein